MKNDNQNRSGEYVKSYESSSYNKEERSHYSSRKVEPKPSVDQGRNVPQNPQSAQNPQSPLNPPTQERKSGLTWKHFIIIWLVFTILWNGINWLVNLDTSDVDEQPEETIDYPWTTDDEDLDMDFDEDVADDVNENGEENVQDDPQPVPDTDDAEAHAAVVKQAELVGVSTEGTTEEILNRIIEKQLESIK